jgi:molybdopterin synthase sulfur carrier subunit
MQIQIILFGRLADIAGNSVSVNNVTDTESLVKALDKNYPELVNEKYVIAVNKQVVNQNTILNADSVVALLPPFSGG